MAARIEYKASVAKDLKKMERVLALRLLNKIEDTLNAEGRHGKPLTGEFAGLFALRSGDYRVIYVPTAEGFLVLRIGHRREVYKRGRPGET